MTTERRGLIAPFRRDRKRDLASGTGLELLVSKVVQVLATEGATPRSSGELPWRTAFGAGLHLLRHERNDLVLRELARVRVRDGLRKWVPSALVSALAVEQDGPRLTIRLRVAERPGGPERTTEVTL
jgi:hypothetical protein